VSAPVLRLADMYEKLGDFRRVEDVCRQGLLQNPSARADDAGTDRLDDIGGSEHTAGCPRCWAGPRETAVFVGVLSTAPPQGRVERLTGGE
jgi:hypothetical protein